MERKTTHLHEKIQSKDEQGIKELVKSHPEWMAFKDEEFGDIPLMYAMQLKVSCSEDIVLYLLNETPTECINDQNDNHDFKESLMPTENFKEFFPSLLQIR
ncbi:uncharacterized protein LOC117117512 [Anneissia japonica]|uniref:uncharacterized protein LOC117117512 n=1 Tax=Anneissia japonica TaxID=1529436 RepID=UPI0014259167|nr:uncharacterized protein LOC117117512 [Anneissia japonica]